MLSHEKQPPRRLSIRAQMSKKTMRCRDTEPLQATISQTHVMLKACNMDMKRLTDASASKQRLDPVLL